MNSSLNTRATNRGYILHCLVLGGTGFIGSHVVETLLRAGHDVRMLSRRPSRYWSPPARVEHIWADWNNEQQLDRAVTGAEIVIHLIGTTLPATSNADMMADVQNNLEVTLRLLHLCLQRGVRKVILASSGGTVYGVPKRLPISEEHPTQPISSYGIVKLAIEKYLHLFHHLHGLDYVVIRASNPYGERQRLRGAQGVVGIFLAQIAREQPIQLWGDGRIVRDYLYVGDLAQAFRLAVETHIEQGVFNVGSGQGVSLIELLDEIQVVTGLIPRIMWQPGRPVDVHVNVLDTHHITSELGWQPTMTLHDGLKRTWDWVQTEVAREALVQ